jgi:membrane protein implicated in regulation of membrane protease activity
MTSRFSVGSFVVAVVACLLCACDTLSVKALGSAELAAGCQVADALTTAAALNAGAVEVNSLMASAIKTLGVTGFVALKIALAYGLYRYMKDASKKGDQNVQVAGTIHNIVICGASIHNVRVLQQLRRAAP